MRTFDRLKEFDERSRSFSIRPLLIGRAPRSYTWSCPAWLDQGSEGACVGFAWAHELAARPSVIQNVAASSAYRIYKMAQTMDDWPGENYEGTSVLGGIKAVQDMFPGIIGGYRWAFSFDDLIETLGYFGPAVLGINWYSGMLNTGSDGFVHATGQVVGGHAILARGVNLKKKAVLLRNSWGEDWGFFGDCMVSFDDMRKLLSEEGEVCIPVRRRSGGGSI